MYPSFSPHNASNQRSANPRDSIVGRIFQSVRMVGRIGNPSYERDGAAGPPRKSASRPSAPRQGPTRSRYSHSGTGRNFARRPQQIANLRPRSGRCPWFQLVLSPAGAILGLDRRRANKDRPATRHQVAPRPRLTSNRSFEGWRRYRPPDRQSCPVRAAWESGACW